MSTISNPAPDYVLVDGSSYLYRAFHAMPELTNSKGRPTGTIKGVINMLRRMAKDYPGAHLVVVFDAKGKTFRDDLFAEYKANRPPMPDDLRQQIEPIHNIVKAMGLPLLIVPGVEADDVIGTLARQAQSMDQQVLISTGDKDMAQLVNSHVRLVNTMTDTLIDEEGVLEKFGVKAEQIIDYLALMGDKVDNIPGVEKCGPKTAVKWLQAYGSLDGVLENADQVKGKVGENLRAAAADLPLSYQLATIKTDVDLEHTLNELQQQPIAEQDLLALYQECEFASWAQELEGKEEGDDSESSSPEVSANYHCVLTVDELNPWLEKIKAAELFAFDTETTSLNYMQAELVGVSLAVEPGEAAYIPCGHDYPGAPEQISRDELLALLKPILESDEHKKVGQNLKYDAHILANYDIALKGIAFDTMLESYLLDSTATRHDMDSLAKFYLNETTITFEEVAGKGAKQIGFNQVDLEQATPYAAEDAEITLRLHHCLWERLQQKPALAALLQELELPLLSILQQVERNGALVNVMALQQQSQELGKAMLELEEKAYEQAGEKFNLGSPKQLQAILFEKQQLPVIKKTPKGQPSTAEPVLQELALDYPLPKLIIDYRSLSKLKSTYTDKLPEQIAASTKRIHTSYHQGVTATGRLSSSDPNLQNIPIRTTEGRRVRQAFVAPEGYQLLAADYSQIELRIMAHLSADKGLLQAFQQGQDVHKATAAEVFGVGIEAISNEQRRKAKAINFGLIYGMSAFGLAKQLGVGRNDAQQYIDTYFERYPGVQAYMENIREQAAADGYVETLFGRRLYLPEIKAKNAMRRQAAERTAINAPMQGTAADIIKRAMLKVDSWLKESDLDAKIIMQVHDELVFEVKTEQRETLQANVCELMAAAADLDVPLLVEAGFGNNWDEAH